MREPWVRKSREFIYKAQTPDEISFLCDRIALPSGKEFNYVYVDCPYQVVFVVGIDDRQRVLMLRQFRYLIDQEIWEVPAGSPDGEEDLETGARREFEEESGFSAGALHHLGSFYSSVGLTNQMNHIFMATDLHESQQKLEESEQINTHWLPLSDAVQMVLEGRVMNVGAAYGILLANARISNHPRK